MLTKEQIEENKNKVIEIINFIQRDGFKKEDLIHQLELSDFFTAPASTKYFNSYEGGLCEHSLNVYNNLLKIRAMNTHFMNYDMDSIRLVGLFHDFYKMNFYEQVFSNKKVYLKTGTKHDENGNFDWVSVKSYTVKDPSKRFLYGTNGETSEFRLRQYIPLTVEESIAIVNLNTENNEYDPEIMKTHPLVLALRFADNIACYVDGNE